MGKHMALHKALRYFFILFALAFLTACGGGGGGSSTPALKSSDITLDGKSVQGLNFSSTGGTTDSGGTTASDGKFSYATGSQITISVGDTAIGAVSAADLSNGGTLTLESLLDDYSGTDPLITDLATLLLENTDPSSGVVVAPSELAALNPVITAILTVNGKPAVNADYSTVVDSSVTTNRTVSLTSGATNNAGRFSYDSLSVVTFKIGSIEIGSVRGLDIPDTGTVSIESLIAGNPAAASNPTLQNLPTILAEDQGVSAARYTLPNNLASLDEVAATILTLGGKPVSGVDYVSGSMSGTTSQNGVFQQDGAQDISFQVAGLDLGPVTTDELPTSIEALVAASTSTNPLIQNLTELLKELNDPEASNPIASFRLYDLEQQLLKPSSVPQNRVLGVNLETPQAESDHINQPLITADIFRVARPFQESSCPDIVYTAAGWPKRIPASCSEADTANGISKYAFTRILQFAPGLSFPEGRYTVLYEGTGNISYSGMGCDVVRVATNHDTIDVKAANACPDSDGSGAGDNYNNKRGLEVSITATDPTDPVRNIRIIAPGGICKGNPFDRVASASSCGSEPFVSFVELLKHNRNAIVFNPDYLKFARDFRVLRMMNIMEASPRRPESQTYDPCDGLTESTTPTYESCLLKAASWNDRPTMDSPYWGGSYKTSVLNRQGVPLELTIALANQLQAHPWYTIPHNAGDGYMSKYATLIADELDDSLVAHIEYSNEVWNAGFWGHHYVQQKGYNDPVISAMEDYPFRNTDYSVRTRYYAKRATEMFKIFEAEFADNSRLKRILGGQHKFHSLAQNLLDYEDTSEHTDAVAIAPYFHGCWSRQFKNGAGDIVDHSSCYNTDTVPMTMSEVTSLEQVFEVMDGDYDDSVTDASLRGDADNVEATIKLIQPQIDVANSHGVELYAYEGGAHLTVNWGDTLISDERKESLWDYFEAANRDDRMGAYYTRLLDGWKEAGAKQFVLFTAPQSFNRYGFFGIKEHLGSTREESPKYDAALTFQEALLGCWPEFVEDGC